MKKIAVILAAGKGERFGSSLPKQFHKMVGEKRMIDVTLDAFLECKDVDEIWLTYPKGFEKEVAGLKDKGIFLVKGGKTGQESLWNALKQMFYDEEDLIIVHDGDRPLVSPELISATVKAAKKHGASCGGLMSTDYVVEGDTKRLLHNLHLTPKRNTLRTCTPQCYPFGVLQAAYALLSCTGKDDVVTPCEIFLELGQEIATVPTTVGNSLKVTTQEEFEVVSLLAARRYKEK